MNLRPLDPQSRARKYTYIFNYIVYYDLMYKSRILKERKRMMIRKIYKITTGNRITIPNEVMLEADVMVGDTVVIWSNGDTIVIEREKEVVELSILIERIKSSVRNTKNLKNRLSLLDKVVELENLIYE